MTPRLRMWVEAGIVEPSIESEKSGQEVRSDLGPMMRISDLLLLSCRKFVCIQFFISVRQLVMVEWVAGVMDLVEM